MITKVVFNTDSIFK